MDGWLHLVHASSFIIFVGIEHRIPHANTTHTHNLGICFKCLGISGRSRGASKTISLVNAVYASIRPASTAIVHRNQTLHFLMPHIDQMFLNANRRRCDITIQYNNYFSLLGRYLIEFSPLSPIGGRRRFPLRKSSIPSDRLVLDSVDSFIIHYTLLFRSMCRNEAGDEAGVNKINPVSLNVRLTSITAFLFAFIMLSYSFGCRHTLAQSVQSPVNLSASNRHRLRLCTNDKHRIHETVCIKIITNNECRRYKHTHTHTNMPIYVPNTRTLGCGW